MSYPYQGCERLIHGKLSTCLIDVKDIHKGTPYSWVRRVNIKMPMIPKVIYGFSTIYENPNDDFHRNRKIYSKHHKETQELSSRIKNPKRQEQSWRPHASGF